MSTLQTRKTLVDVATDRDARNACLRFFSFFLFFFFLLSFLFILFLLFLFASTKKVKKIKRNISRRKQKIKERKKTRLQELGYLPNFRKNKK